MGGEKRGVFQRRRLLWRREFGDFSRQSVPIISQRERVHVGVFFFPDLGQLGVDDAGYVDEFRHRTERSDSRIETLGRTSKQTGTVPVDENHHAGVPGTEFNV